jgi:coenzyme PQQ precursor peptide PqqA
VRRIATLTLSSPVPPTLNSRPYRLPAFLLIPDRSADASNVCCLHVASVGFDRSGGARYGWLNGTPLGFRFRKAIFMSWETPSFIEIDMSAEIGSYEGEDFNGL